MLLGTVAMDIDRLFEEGSPLQLCVQHFGGSLRTARGMLLRHIAAFKHRAMGVLRDPASI